MRGEPGHRTALSLGEGKCQGQGEGAEKHAYVEKRLH